MLRISPRCDVTGGENQICPAGWYFTLCWHTYSRWLLMTPNLHSNPQAWPCTVYISHTVACLTSNITILSAMVVTDTAIHQRHIWMRRVFFIALKGKRCRPEIPRGIVWGNIKGQRVSLQKIKFVQPHLHVPPNLRGSSESVFQREGRVHWSVSVWRRFLQLDTVRTHRTLSLQQPP